MIRERLRSIAFNNPLTRRLRLLAVEFARSTWRDQRPDVEARRRIAALAENRHSDFGEVELPEIPLVPGMISDAECRYLYWLLASGYTGFGAVVEVGPWLGKSTIHLAAGLRDSGHPTMLHCYDRFRWMSIPRSDPLEGPLARLKEGDDFQPHFENFIRPFYPNLSVTKVDATNIVWLYDPIEVLFIDGPKTLADISETLLTFGPCLVEGRSIVAMQDYFHSPSYPIAAVVSQIPQLEYRHSVADSSTCSFAVTGPFNLTHRPASWRILDWSAFRIQQTWDRILEPLAPQARSYMAPGAAFHLFDAGFRNAAIERIRGVEFCESGLARWAFLAGVRYYRNLYGALFEATGA